MKGKAQKCLVIVIEDVDMFESQALHEFLLRLLHRRGVAGATVSTGLAGYGEAGHISRRGLFGFTDEKPIILQAVDDEEKLREILPEIREKVQGGLVYLMDVEVL